MTLAIELPPIDPPIDPLIDPAVSADVHSAAQQPNFQLLDPSWERRSTRHVFRIWLIVFALVGGQMGWVLRPFIGHPGTPFSWFRPKQSNFFEAIVGDIRIVVGGEIETPNRRAE